MEPLTTAQYDKIDVEQLLKEYSVSNVEGFFAYLVGIWKDLVERSDNKYLGINKMTFTQYYELPGMISSRLFNVFDEECTEYLNLNSFVKGMMSLFTKGFDELVKFVFKFYDFDRDGAISKEDIRIVLSYVPLNKERFKRKKCVSASVKQKEDFVVRMESQDELHNILESIFNNDTITLNEKEFIKIVEDVNSDIFLYIIIFLLEKRPFNNKTIENLDNIKKSPNAGNAHNAQTEIRLIRSPRSNSIFQPCAMISNSPGVLRTKSTEMVVSSNQKNVMLETKAQMKIDKCNKADMLFKLSGVYNNNKEHIAGINVEHVGDHNEKYSQPIRKNRQVFTTGTHPNNSSNSNNTIINEQDKVNIINNIEQLLEARQFEFKEQTKEPNDDDSEDSYESSPSTSNNNSHIKDEEKNAYYSGYIYKITPKKQLKKIWFCLIYKDFYFYRTKEDTLHKGMHNLSGAFIKEEKETTINNKHFYCFSLIVYGKAKKYYIDNKTEYDNWITNIKKAVGYSNLNDIYDIKDTLGCGKFATVKLGINKQTEEKVAIKTMSKYDMSPFDLEQVQTEIEILKIANHPHIIRLYDVFENLYYIYIIMEYCEGGDLFSYLERRQFKLPERTAAVIIEQLATAIYYLHEYGIVHRDIKPENILMVNDSDKPDIKLVDFGLGKILAPNEMCYEAFGTLSYVAPEVLQEKKYNKSVDLWSLGVITYLLLTGFLPFDGDSPQDIVRQTIEEPVPFPEKVWNGISSDAKCFVENLLNKEPDKRMDIKKVLDHKWLDKYLNKPKHMTLIRSNSISSGGAEFKKYSSPSTKYLDDEEIEIGDMEVLDLNNNTNNGANTNTSSSSSNVLTTTTNQSNYILNGKHKQSNILNVPGFRLINLPIYTNKKTDDKKDE